MVPGYKFGVPLGPPGTLFSSIWAPKGALEVKLLEFLMILISKTKGFWNKIKIATDWSSLT